MVVTVTEWPLQIQAELQAVTATASLAEPPATTKTTTPTP